MGVYWPCQPAQKRPAEEHPPWQGRGSREVGAVQAKMHAASRLMSLKPEMSSALECMCTAHHSKGACSRLIDELEV